MTDADASNFLIALGVSEIGRTILRRAAQEFEERGTWVTIDTLAYEFADSDIPSADLNEVYTIPAVLGSTWNGEQFALTGLGLIEAETAPRVSDQMARIAKISADRKREFRDEATISREILESEYDFAHEDAIRAIDLVQRVPGLTSSGSMGNDWWFTLWRGALDYKKIASVEDLRIHFEKETSKTLRTQRQRLVNSPALALSEDFDPESMPELPSSERSSDAAGGSLEGSPYFVENFHAWVWNASSKLWKDGHLREAVASAASAIFDLELPTKMGVHRGPSAAALVSSVFSTKDPTTTDRRLRFPGLAKGTPDWTNALEGAGALGRACAMGIRNATTHGSVPDEKLALEQLATLSLLARWIDEAVVESAQ